MDSFWREMAGYLVGSICTNEECAAKAQEVIDHELMRGEEAKCVKPGGSFNYDDAEEFAYEHNGRLLTHEELKDYVGG